MSPARTRSKKAAGDQTQNVHSAATESEVADELPLRSRTMSSQPNKMMVFDDDGLLPPGLEQPEAKSTTSKPPVIADSEDESASDDEAPEAVSTQKAASEVKKSSQAAQKMAQEDAALQKRKRQERDALFKKQAEERKQAEQDAKAVVETALSEDQGLAETNAPRSIGAMSGRQRANKSKIPTTLPTEFLTDSSEDEGDDDDAGAGQSRSKRRKVATVEKQALRLNRPPRDERLGNTIYRVSKTVDTSLPPKARKYALGSKEALMKRNRPSVQQRGAFFAKKK